MTSDETREAFPAAYRKYKELIVQRDHLHKNKRDSQEEELTQLEIEISKLKKIIHNPANWNGS
ncbi:MAG: hypothetical protein CMB80_00115 [Flammeovirgaceae bacterium]|nr:hypothetical protein [Flammeovirgaceae bacterium]|tara:strand:- start:1794 stop:1982 length:189 start_codon:yes stop_codon:yes gene_type:complete